MTCGSRAVAHSTGLLSSVGGVPRPEARAQVPNSGVSKEPAIRCIGRASRASKARMGIDGAQLTSAYSATSLSWSASWTKAARCGFQTSDWPADAPDPIGGRNRA
jgi:hypothetical protein